MASSVVATTKRKRASKKPAWPTTRTFADFPSFAFLNVAHWSTQYDVAHWRHMEAIGKLEKKSRNIPYDILSTSAVLPDASGDAIAYLSCHRDRTGNEVHWALLIRSRPSSPPPKDVQSGTKKVGGIQGLYQFVISTFVPSKKPIAIYEGSVRIPEKPDWVCRLIPQPVASASIVADLGQNARLEEVGYRFEHEGIGLDEFRLTYGHREKEFSLRFRASGPLDVTCGTELHLSMVDQWTEQLLGKFFLKK